MESSFCNVSTELDCDILSLFYSSPSIAFKAVHESDHAKILVLIICIGLPEGLGDGYVIINVFVKVSPTDKLLILLCCNKEHKRKY